ncbi:MAG: RimK-like ATPgrasp N-terminal domain-containing protein [Methanomicrobiales archaeon]|nr:RimK-like ATPgrasp N-terminal domain-containing protein [Methanomicrobiales archaeon]
MVTASPALKKDTLYIRVEDETAFFISDNYFYKSDAYYRIVQNELEGRSVIPSSKEVIEAFVVPICLEKAQMKDIPTLPWEVSYSYAPLPSIAYGIHYYSDPSDYSILRESEVAREVIRHITNNGKYPFCYQPIPDTADVLPIVSIFGTTTSDQQEIQNLARRVYEVFRVPFLSITAVYDGEAYRLSSLTNAKYSKLAAEDRSLLRTFLEGNRT